MKITQLRISNRKKACLSNIYIDGELFCFGVEDIVREGAEKIKHETAIPAGKYQVKFRTQDSPMRRKYRDKYDWFVDHLQIQDVPGFQHIYLHTGNVPEHSSGCVLINGKLNSEHNKGEESRVRFQAFYRKVKTELDQGKEVTIEIRNVFQSV